MADGFTNLIWAHAILGVVAIVAGVVVVKALLDSRAPIAWTHLYIWSALLTSGTGFVFLFEVPPPRLVDSNWIGGASFAVLAVALEARYGFRLVGAWRWIYALGLVLGLWFLFVELIGQVFKWVPALSALAPTQTEPAFLAAQLVLLAIFAWIAIKAVRAFQPRAED